MKHLGDITKIHGDEIEPVDMISGGSPCQDLSVVGLRKGLKHDELGDGETTRSGLFMEQVRIVKEMRDRDKRDGRTGELIRPRFMVWENVPGAFSSNKGKDFQAVLTEIIRIAEPEAPDVEMPDKWPSSGCIWSEVGRWSVAYRTVDAQYWGTPQRRKRIALVADFNGLTAGDILFDAEYRGEAEDGEPDQTVRDSGAEFGRTEEVSAVSEGMPGDIEPGGEAGEGTAAGAESGVASTITSAYGTKWNGNAGAYSGGNFAIERRGGNENPGAISTMRNQSVLAYGISAYDSNSMKSPNPHSGIYKADTSRTLDLNGGSPACNQGGMMVLNKDGVKTFALEGNGARESHFGNGFAESDTMYTLNTVEQHAVAAVDCGNGVNDPNVGNPVYSSTVGSYMTFGEEVAQTLMARDYKDPQIVSAPNQEACPTTESNRSAFAVDVYNQTVEGEVAPTVTAAAGGTNTSGPKVMTIPINTMVGTRNSEEKRTTFGVGEADDPQFTISAAHEHAVFAFAQNQRDEVRDLHDVAGSLAAEPGMKQQTFVAGFSFGQSEKARSLGYQEEVSPTLRGGEGGNQKPVCLEIKIKEEETVAGEVGESADDATSFEPGIDSTEGGHCYDCTPQTLRANAEGNQMSAACLNAWDVQCKHIQSRDGIADTLYAGECRYGGGESYVLDGDSDS